jgi:hypothetical protein
MKKLLDADDPVTTEMNLYQFSVPDTFEWKHDRKLGQDLADLVSKEWNKQIVPRYEDPRVGHGYYTSYARFQCVVVLFCGKLYRGIRYSERWSYLDNNVIPTSLRGDPGMVSRVYWDAASFVADFHQVDRRGKLLEDAKYVRSGNAVLTYFQPQNNRVLMDLHFKTGCPVIGLEKDPESKTAPHWSKRFHHVAVLNPSLREMQFFRVTDVNSAFQELSMFVGGVLANNDKPESVDNNYKILAHGFDLKESFRKGPTKEHR